MLNASKHATPDDFEAFFCLHSVRPARLTIPVRLVRRSLEFGFGSVGSVSIRARPVSGSVVAELMLGC